MIFCRSASVKKDAQPFVSLSWKASQLVALEFNLLILTFYSPSSSWLTFREAKIQLTDP